MPKKHTTRVTTVREEQDRPDNPIPKLIRSYLLDGEDFPDELREYQYKITIQKFNRDGRPITVTGRVYDNLEDLPYQLGSRFGTARFKLFIVPTDSEGERKPLVKIEDFPVEWDGEDPVEDLQEESAGELAAGNLQLQLEQLKHQHAKELKQMEMNKEMFIAAMNAKGGGGGLKVGDILQLLNTGIALGSGRDVSVAGEGDGGGGSDIMGILNGPLGQALVRALMPGPVAPAAPPPREAPVHVEGSPGPPPLDT